jgi:hypothetical protein
MLLTGNFVQHMEIRNDMLSHSCCCEVTYAARGRETYAGKVREIYPFGQRP